MNRILLLAGGLLNLALAAFKIAMPHLFHWKEAMGSSQTFMQTTVYAENLGISLLLLFFAYLSVFNHRELLETDTGRIVLLSIGSLWAYRAAAEIFLYRIGVDGTWWRVYLFLAAAGLYLLPLAMMTRRRESRSLAAR
jgi:hypothetical protein